MTEMMKRWELRALGLQNLEMREAPRPLPRDGEVLVRVDAVSLNARDHLNIEYGLPHENSGGAKLELPFTPASDMAGEVVAVGGGVTRFQPGDRVVSHVVTDWIDGPLTNRPFNTQGGPIQGMLSDYVATPAEWLVRAPASLEPAAASTLPLAALTAWTALVELGHVRAGETVLIQGTGGVSLFGLQFAVAQGARVIITSSGDEKLKLAMQLGASEGINRNDIPDWPSAANKLTGGRGCDHILDVAGGGSVAKSLECVAPSGKVYAIGVLESADLAIPMLPLIYNAASVIGISIGSRRSLEDMIRAVDHCGIKPVIDNVYDFAEVPEAFQHLQRGAFGKIVIKGRGE
jgi:NADPH:quinone reductase-like Zn-dependent oxidoreductase